MRIISGKWKGKQLLSPKTDKIRPTLDRVRESVFSIINKHIIDAKVLDLFSGTGSLGIEALSRGAKEVYFNDINKQALKLIYDNIRLTQFESCVKISKKEYDKCLTSFKNIEDKFNIIFIDPPYDSTYEENALNLIVKFNILKEDGIIVLETDKRKRFNENIKGLVLKDKRKYGRIIIRLYIWEA